jgi:hypothetical protein
MKLRTVDFPELFGPMKKLNFENPDMIAHSGPMPRKFLSANPLK